MCNLSTDKEEQKSLLNGLRRLAICRGIEIEIVEDPEGDYLSFETYNEPVARFIEGFVEGYTGLKSTPFNYCRDCAYCREPVTEFSKCLHIKNIFVDINIKSIHYTTGRDYPEQNHEYCRVVRARKDIGQYCPEFKQREEVEDSGKVSFWQWLLGRGCSRK